MEETFAGPPFSQANTGLKPERSRSFEAGMQQDFFRGKVALNATYFNNLFHGQINYVTVDPVNFIGEYVNVNKAFAQGAEVEIQARLRSRLLLNSTYTYTSSQYLDNPAPFDPARSAIIDREAQLAFIERWPERPPKEKKSSKRSL